MSGQRRIPADGHVFPFGVQASACVLRLDPQAEVCTPNLFRATFGIAWSRRVQSCAWVLALTLNGGGD